MSVKYATLVETSSEDYECWYYFIRWNGNEKALSYLNHQLSKFDTYVLDELNTFDLDTVNLVSERTVREMCSLNINHKRFHQKFDGILKTINFKFRSNEPVECKVWKVHKKLGEGKISKYMENRDEDQDMCKSDLSDYMED